MWKRATCGRIAAALGAWCILSAAAAHADSSPNYVQEFTGKIGGYPVQMQLVVRDRETFTGGHYFYTRALNDIPLTVRTAGRTLVMEGADGGTFRLKTWSKDAKPGAPPPLSQATGLSGVWTRGKVSLPVRLGMSWSTAADPGRLYADVTSLTDQAYEARVRAFLQAVLKGDRAAGADFVSYPLTVNETVRGRARHRDVPDRATLLREWEQVFTPALLQKLRTAVPHEMFARGGNVCLGEACDLWLNGRGLMAVNKP